MILLFIVYIKFFFFSNVIKKLLSLHFLLRKLIFYVGVVYIVMSNDYDLDFIFLLSYIIIHMFCNVCRMLILNATTEDAFFIVYIIYMANHFSWTNSLFMKFLVFINSTIYKFFLIYFGTFNEHNVKIFVINIWILLFLNSLFLFLVTYYYRRIACFKTQSLLFK